MTSVFRAAAVYFALLILFRFAGRRTVAQMTSFDLVLTLIVSEGVSQGLTGQDHSITNAILVATTLILLDIGIAWIKSRFDRVDDWLEGRPVILVNEGKLLEERMRRARVDREDILAAARERLGLESMEQIKYAVLESSGGISVIPHSPSRPLRRERATA